MVKVTDFHKIAIGHFMAPESHEERLRVISNSLNYIEIEVSSYCNRTCSFCPNSFIDRKSKNIFIDDVLYENIINEISTFKYKGYLVFARYSEPLADKSIIERISYARKAIPECSLKIISNGDYINKGYMDLLEKSDLNVMTISGYLKDGDDFSEENVTRCIEKIQRKTGIMDMEWSHIYDGAFARKVGHRGRMEVSIKVENFSVRGQDRGGLILDKRSLRTSPCAEPFFKFFVDYNGKVVPCCNIRSDSDSHFDYILGDLNHESIIDVYFSKKAEKWRRGLFSFSDNLSTPCCTCTKDIYEDSQENRMYIDRLRSKFPDVIHRRNSRLLAEKKDLENKNRILLSHEKELKQDMQKIENEKMQACSLIKRMRDETWYKIGRKLGLVSP